MNWIARCPECGTHYKVVSDQLEMADGWLLCGQCQHAFDSTGLCVAWPVATFALYAQGQDPREASERLHMEDLLKKEDRSTPNVLDDAVVTAFEDALRSFKPVPLTPVTSVEPLETPAEPPSLAAAPTLVNPESEHRARWAYRFAAFVLLVTLALQWLWVERLKVIHHLPQSELWLQQTCQILRCAIPVLQVKDGVVIENSDLVAQNSGYGLKWVFRNATPSLVQMPALELTLLSAQDQSLVRKVITPDLFRSPLPMQPGEVRNLDVQLILDSAFDLAGYRLVAFYP